MLATLSAASAMGLAHAQTAFADPTGDTEGQNEDTGAKPDPNFHNACYRSGTPADMIYLATESLNTTASASDLNGRVVGECESLEIDVRIINIDLPTGFGSAPCVDPFGPGPGVECNRYEARIDRAAVFAATSPNSLDIYGLRKTICHELGHTMGLTHYKDNDNDFPNAPSGQQDCMISGIVPDDSDTYGVYSNHHKGHINAEF